jgi:hypothetical protein
MCDVVCAAVTITQYLVSEEMRILNIRDNFNQRKYIFFIKIMFLPLRVVIGRE